MGKRKTEKPPQPTTLEELKGRMENNRLDIARALGILETALEESEELYTAVERMQIREAMARNPMPKEGA